MNKTLYIRPESLEIWDRAKAAAEAAGTGLSQLLIHLLTEYLDKQPACCGVPLRPEWLHCPRCGRVVKGRTT